MKALKCQMPGCKQYIVEDEAKAVLFEGKSITICEICDDGTFTYIDSNVGGNHGKLNKTEKIKKKRKREND